MERQGRGSGRRVTLATVADAVGVSGATVSNAFNRPDQLSEDLRTRILAAAAELGYQGPDPTARALSRGRTGLIGLVFTESLAFALTDPAAVLMLQGLGSACDRADMGLVLMPVAPGERRPMAASRAGVDGYVVYSMPDGDPSVQAVLSSRRPVVTIDQPQVDGVPFVGVDDRRVARLQLGHLLGLGHRHVGVLAYRLTPERRDAPLPPEVQAVAAYRSTRLRLAGYRDALADAALEPDSIAFQESDANDAGGGHVAAARLLDRSPPPTALLADADQLALGALLTARDRGLHVPTDVSVIGTDDIPGAALASPPLTTVSQSAFEKGRSAGEFLLQAIEGGETVPPTTFLPVELVLRGTTAAPPRAG